MKTLKIFIVALVSLLMGGMHQEALGQGCNPVVTSVNIMNRPFYCMTNINDDVSLEIQWGMSTNDLTCEAPINSFAIKIDMPTSFVYRVTSLADVVMTGPFSWTYDGFNNSLRGVNNVSLPWGMSGTVKVKLKGNSPLTTSCIDLGTVVNIQIVPNPPIGTGSTANFDNFTADDSGSFGLEVRAPMVITTGTINSCYPDIASAEAAAFAATVADTTCLGTTTTKTVSTSGTCSAIVSVLVTNDCRDTSTVTYNTRIDNIAPVIAGAPAAITVECLDEVPAMIDLAWTDNCDLGGNVIGVDGPLVGGECGGTITRTWNVMDGCGNPAATRIQIITIDDITAPVIAAAPAAVTVECLDEVPAMIDLAWTDNCDLGGDVTGIDGPVVGGVCGGTITRTWSVMDACGNPATRTQIITIDDNTAPVIAAAPAAVTVECLDEVPAMIDLAWTDNCDLGGNVIGVDGPLVGGECGGTITRTWNVMDACGNPAATRIQIITIDDNTAPVIAAAPAAVSVECLDEVPAMIDLAWTDNCDLGGDVTGIDGPVVGGVCGGTITRTWSVMDACGNPAATRTQIITIDDNTAPVIAAAPAAVSVECLDEVPAMINLAWTDNCDLGGNVTGVDGPLIGGECGGTITRTWNVMDACGNPATQTQIITIDDNTVPTVTSVPAGGATIAGYTCGNVIPVVVSTDPNGCTAFRFAF